MSFVAPIALFIYARPEHTVRTLEALCANFLADQSDLIVFADGARSTDDESMVAAARRVAYAATGFKSVRVVEREKNYGLAENIIRGVTQLCNEYGKLIVIEDDLVTSPYFLQYMNEALQLYEHTSEIVSIHGYIYPVWEKMPESFFIRGADCWGWATWKRGWDLFNQNGKSLLEQLETRKLCNKFDFDGSYPYTAMLRDQIAGNNDSWAICWYASAFLAGGLTLYPGRSLVHNIGNDGSGTHCSATNALDVSLASKPILLTQLPLTENNEARRAIIRYFTAPHVIKLNVLSRFLKGLKQLCLLR